MGYRVFSDSPSPLGAFDDVVDLEGAPAATGLAPPAGAPKDGFGLCNVVTSFSANAGEVRTASYVEVMPGVIRRGGGAAPVELPRLLGPGAHAAAPAPR